MNHFDNANGVSCNLCCWFYHGFEMNPVENRPFLESCCGFMVAKRAENSSFPLSLGSEVPLPVAKLFPFPSKLLSPISWEIPSSSLVNPSTLLELSPVNKNKLDTLRDHFKSIHPWKFKIDCTRKSLAYMLLDKIKNQILIRFCIGDRKIQIFTILNI